MRLILLALALIPVSAHSGIYKCLINGVPTYQSNPCPANAELKSDVSHLKSKAPTYSDNHLRSGQRQSRTQTPEGNYLHELRVRRFEEDQRKLNRKLVEQERQNAADAAKLDQRAREWEKEAKIREKAIAKCKKRRKKYKDPTISCW